MNILRGLKNSTPEILCILLFLFGMFMIVVNQFSLALGGCGSGSFYCNSMKLLAFIQPVFALISLFLIRIIKDSKVVKRELKVITITLLIGLTAGSSWIFWQDFVRQLLT